MNELERMRVEKDEFFRSDPDSPLTEEQKAEFTGLHYFPENNDLRIEVTIKETTSEQVNIDASKGAARSYQKVGRFQFTVDGKLAELTIYENEYGYFLPFVDSLAGSETYPAGRYIEPELQSPKHFMIDFNLAYNPYCAYNDRWSCPLTPAENRLSVPIRAGEKKFHE
jgi:uncharacterized protein (DUF1684 family)